MVNGLEITFGVLYDHTKQFKRKKFVRFIRWL